MTQLNSMKPAPDSVLVLGAGRGLGRGIATAFANGGSQVVAVSRTVDELDSLAAEHARISVHVGDAIDDDLPARLVGPDEPTVVILVAGALPPTAPVHRLSWEEFSVNWHTDVRAAFVWARAALSTPWPPGSQLVIVSSRAALGGSPISGGYAGAKATQRFLAGYAQAEADGADLGLTFTTVLPMLTPVTELGRAAIRVYAERNQQSEADLVQQMGSVLTTQIAGAAVVEVVNRAAAASNRTAAWELDGGGLHPIPPH